MKSKNRIVLALDSQQVSNFSACPAKYFQVNVLDLVHRVPVRAYEIGSLIHEILRRINRAKLNHRKGFRFGPSYTFDFKTDTKLLEIGFRALKRSRTPKLSPEDLAFHTSQFVSFYAWRKQQERFLKPIGSEVGFSKIIYEDKDVVFVYEGKIDEIVRIEPDGRLGWVDYKSQSREYQIYRNRNQFLGYSWALETNVGFICYYGLQKVKENPFKYVTLSHTNSLLAQWKCDTIRIFRQIVNLLPFGQEAFERRRNSCDSSNFGLCQFVRLCDNITAPVPVQIGLKRMWYKEEKWIPWP